MKKILGIDIGGTKVAAGLVDARGRISQVRVAPTSQPDLLDQLMDLIAGFKGFTGIGLGLPGRVEASGLVRKLPNIRGFRSLNLKQYLAKKFKVPVMVINDGEAFTLAEAQLGAGRGRQTVAGLVMGTGVGGGLVKHGKLIRNQGLMVKIGHLKMTKTETYEEVMHRTGTNAHNLQPIIADLLDLIIRRLKPDVIVCTGGRFRDPGIDQALGRVLKSLPYPIKARVSISKLKNAGILGAAWLLLKK